MSQPLVSIIIPTYKRPVYLQRALNSVFAQTYVNWELIVVDDNDPKTSYREETVSFMANYAAHPSIRYVQHNCNQGGSAARNTGIELAIGEYVAFLDDDDEWLPSKLAKQVECFSEHDETTALVSTGYVAVKEQEGKTKTFLPHLKGYILPYLLKRNYVGTTSTILCRRSALVAVGMFDEKLPAKQDIDLYIRVATKYKFDFVAEPLVRFYRHSNASISGDIQSSLEAHRYFHRKHKNLIERDPEIHHYRLKWEGKVLLRAQRSAEAREVLKQAFLLQPFNLEVFALLGFSALAPGFQKRLRNLKLRRRQEE